MIEAEKGLPQAVLWPPHIHKANKNQIWKEGVDYFARCGRSHLCVYHLGGWNRRIALSLRQWVPGHWVRPLLQWSALFYLHVFVRLIFMKKSFYYFMCLWMLMWICTCIQVLRDARQRCWIPQSWSYRLLWIIQHGCWCLNSSSLED